MKYLKKTVLFGVIALIIVLFIDYSVSHKAKDFIYDDISTISKNKVGLILGASKLTTSGNINLYYKYRLEAAISLYKAGKIELILISGDNGRKGYDEPTDFKNDLIKNGIPENKIFLDYAGFRTLDSIVRAKEVFGLTEYTIISQKFHNERAIYLARHFNINAIAFNAKDTPTRYIFKTKLREYLARTKASIDMLFNVSPKFLGDKIEIK
ncbi:protein SanA [Flavivirga aquatica]|uniref:Protein SanA n=1 Tax=Flavivirga aquatica TaxID=1849968 RepID=A0A1E5SIQ4_9FLAO|nr:ElyC/SanA/YdcF family protein [Flavivirga aquatica]OEJ98998.1 protein SanA [Flavivirga aquatica]